jgi:hypothetical protein
MVVTPFTFGSSHKHQPQQMRTRSALKCSRIMTSPGIESKGGSYRTLIRHTKISRPHASVARAQAPVVDVRGPSRILSCPTHDHRYCVEESTKPPDPTLLVRARSPMTLRQEAASWWPFGLQTSELSAVPDVGARAPSTELLPMPAGDGKATIVTFLRHCGCPC